jgi:hypothetical protein
MKQQAMCSDCISEKSTPIPYQYTGIDSDNRDSKIFSPRESEKDTI